MKSLTMTDIGLVRTSNQDLAFISDSPVGKLPNLYLIADGMGGHLAGDFASDYAVHAFIRAVNESEGAFKDPSERMADAVSKVNAGLHPESAKDGPHRGTGTTFVAMTMVGSSLYAVNVGDSRIYMLGDQITQVTEDHSFAEELVRRGQIMRDTEEYMNSRHILTRAVGPWESVEVDQFREEVEKDEILLLCSDGLYNMISDDRILEITQSFRPYSQESLTACARTMIDEANRNGGVDNMTLIFVLPDFAQTAALEESQC